MKTSLKLVLPLAGLAVMAMGSAKADAVADFYKGKTVSIFVGVSPGGIYSTFAQFLAKHMKRHFPGNPDIIVKHMPGGGGMKANNYVYNVAPRDGTALLTPNSSPAKNVLFGKGAKYDPVKFNWVGSWGSTTNALSLLKKNKPAATTMEEAKTRQVIIGSIGRSSSAFMLPTMYNNLLGTKFKIIPGYRGGSPIRLAMEKGEIAGWAGQWTGMKLRKKEWIEGNMLYNLVQVGPKKHKDLPDVPLLTDLAKTDDQKFIFDIMSSTTTDRALVLPPDVPKDRIAAVEKAFMATLADKEFLAEVGKRGFEIDPSSGKELTATVQKIMGLSPEKVDKLKTAIGLKK
jgi:tripartite-type tricarboxylate transporter receptor subunit TctC